MDNNSIIEKIKGVESSVIVSEQSQLKSERKAFSKPDPSNYIHPTCVIGPNVEIGTGNHFGPFCLIGSPAEGPSFGKGIVGKVKIGDNNIFYGFVAVDAATNENDYTTIGNNNVFKKHTHVNHDEFIGNDEYINR